MKGSSQAGETPRCFTSERSCTSLGRRRIIFSAEKAFFLKRRGVLVMHIYERRYVKVQAEMNRYTYIMHIYPSVSMFVSLSSPCRQVDGSSTRPHGE